MRTSKQGQQGWIVRTVLMAWWMGGAAALSQTTQQQPAGSVPQPGVAQPVGRPAAQASTRPSAVAPVPTRTPSAPAVVVPSSQASSLPAALPSAAVAQAAPPKAPQAAGTARPVPATAVAQPARTANQPALQVAPPIVTTTENPVFQPANVPVSPSAIVTVPIISTVPQLVPAAPPAASPSRVRPSTLPRRAAATSSKPAAAIAVQAGPSTPPQAAAPDPPPPYPVPAHIVAPEPTVPGTGIGSVLGPGTPAGANPNIVSLRMPAPLPAKRTMLNKLIPANPNIADNSLNSYVERLRRETSSTQTTTGAIWTESGRLTRLNTDVRAMRPNDLIQVVVLENLAASTDGTVKNQRASAANSSISSLIGALHAGNALQNLVNQSSANSLNATGASATNSSLTTTFGGQVIEVLPNGMLVIEAARQVEFSQQTQTIILRGLVRPEDISQENQVKSTAISSLELEVKGKGIVNDYTRRQNPLVRLLQQILIF